MRDTLILHLPEDPGAACRWQVQRVGAETPLLAESGSLEAAVSAVGPHRLVLLVPSEQVLLTHVSLAVRAAAKLQQAVPYALEEQLAEDVQLLHFALGSRQADGVTPVAVVSHEQMRQWLTPFTDAGITPELVIPDVLALPRPEGRPSVFMDRQGRCLLHTGPAQGLATQVELLEHLVPQLALEPETAWNLYREDGAAEVPASLPALGQEVVDEPLQALTSVYDSDRINLLQGPYAPRHASAQWLRMARLPAALAAGWVILASATLALANVQLSQEREALREQAQTHFNAAFPDITRVVDMRVQAEQALERLRGGGASSGFLYLLSQSSSALDAVDALQLDGLQYRDGALYLSLSGDDLQALEKLRAEFGKNPRLALDVQSAQAGSEGVQIRLKVDPA